NSASYTLPVHYPQSVLGSIGNRVWQDSNGNGIQDPGEPGLAGVTVQLLAADGLVSATTTTDSTGAYNFANVPPGSYSVAVQPPAGYAFATKDAGGNDAV